MRITSLDVTAVSIPIAPERMITSARGTHASSPFAIVEIGTNEGLVGLGEVSATPLWSGEDSGTATHVIQRYIAPVILGEHVSPLHLAERVEAAVAGHHFTKAAVEMAIWDLHGKRLGSPLFELWGGPSRKQIRTKYSIAGTEPDTAAESARWAIAQGFRALKVKVAIGDDVFRFAAVRDAAGPDVPVGVDANGGWTRAQAERIGRDLVEAGAAFVEQPLMARDLEGLAQLRGRLGVPIVADESVGTPADAVAVVRAGAADILSIYVGMAGGLSAAMQIASLAHAAGLGWTIGSNLEMGVGMAAHLQLAFSAPGIADDTVPCDILSPFYYEGDISTGIPVAAGHATPPTGPGLGVTLDADAMERFTVTNAP